MLYDTIVYGWCPCQVTAFSPPAVERRDHPAARQSKEFERAACRNRSMENISFKKYPPVGRCIYCGCTEGLEDEHIFPFGLDGTAILPKSSCRACARITGRHEQIVLRGSMWAVRVFRGIKSRRKHRSAPKTYPLTVISQGAEEVVELPAEQYPILLPFPIFGPPAFLRPAGYRSGIVVLGVRTISFGPAPEEVIRNLGADALKIARQDEPVAFARVIAKIAYAAAVASGMLEMVDSEPRIVQSILGSVDDIGRWVGTIGGPPQSFTGQLHRILFQRDEVEGLLLSEVQLFSDSQTPRYIVILGKLQR
jgi:hypothetical protein